MDDLPRRSPLSCAVYAADSFASRAAVAVIVAVLVTASLVGLATGVLPTSWRVWFETISSAITLTMVFSIQHAQTRNQAALQLKMDELLRVVPEADDRVVKIETAPDDELHELHTKELEHRVAAYAHADPTPPCGVRQPARPAAARRGRP